MNVKKIGAIAKVVKNIADSDNRGEALGAAVAGAVTVAHPIAGAVAAPAIKKGTEKLYDAGVKVANDPEVRAKAKRGVQRGRAAVGSAVSRVGELAQGLKK